jgi:hypothetical protein
MEGFQGSGIKSDNKHENQYLRQTKHNPLEPLVFPLVAKVVVITSWAIIALGGAFMFFSLAPAPVPGGVRTGPLEFGGRGIADINALELLFGAIIVIIGSSLWKLGYRHKVIFFHWGCYSCFLSECYCNTFKFEFVLVFYRNRCHNSIRSK